MIARSNDPGTRLNADRMQHPSGHVNAPISDSAMFAFSTGAEMTEMFEVGIAGRFLYSRHANPSCAALAAKLAAMEATEAAVVTASGMSAIACAILQVCSAGDHIIASRTVYGGTYALLENFLPRFGISTSFIDINNQTAITEALKPNTKMVFAETMSNPLLAVCDIPSLSAFAHSNGLTLMIDNTFAPLICSPAKHGADIVIHSLTKYINGMGDHLGGVICGTESLIQSLMDVNSGATMLLGPSMDAGVAADIRKNLQSLPVRVRQHSANALKVGLRLQASGFRVVYPGLETHPDHMRLLTLSNEGYGAGAVLTLDCGTRERADSLMQHLKDAGLGFLAVSLGYVHTLFSMPACSTSSEIPAAERERMGLSEGFVRFSIGIDADGDWLASEIATIATKVLL